MTLTGIVFVICTITGAVWWAAIFAMTIAAAIRSLLKPPVKLPQNLHSDDWTNFDKLIEDKIADEIAKRLYDRMSRISMGKGEPGAN